MLVIRLAIRDLLFQKAMLICNIALIVGIILPLLVLQGARGGLYQKMLNDLTQDPNVLRIDTTGNVTFSPADRDAVAAMPGVAFAVLMPRAFSDVVRLRNPRTRSVDDAVALTTGTGDPFQNVGQDLTTGQVAVTRKLADSLGLQLQDPVDLISTAENRPRQLRVTLTVAQILPDRTLTGRTILVLPETSELFEAFIDNYALPEFGITTGKDLSTRVPSFERLRVHVDRLEDVAPIQDRIEKEFQVFTRADSVQIQSTLQLGQTLGRAMILLSSTALIGLVAALGFSFWAEVNRKRQTLSVLSILGVSNRALFWYPVVQAMLCAVAGLVVSFAAYVFVQQITKALFASLAMDGASVQIPLVQALTLSAGIMVLIAVASGAAAVRVRSIDPAKILREV